MDETRTVSAEAYRRLLKACRLARRELLRLHRLHKPIYEGKIGEPDLAVVTMLNDALAAARKEG